MKEEYFPRKENERYMMFKHLAFKIDEYKTYLNLTDEFVAHVKLLAQAFGEIYNKSFQNRASARALTSYKKNVLNGTEKTRLVGEPPIFVPIQMPAGVKVGLIPQMRHAVRFIRAQNNYTPDIGFDLGIAPNAKFSLVENTVAPELRLKNIAGGLIEVKFKKRGLDGLRLDFQRNLLAAWETSGNIFYSPFVFKVPDFTEGTAQIIFLRGIYLRKNDTFGNYSVVYQVPVY